MANEPQSIRVLLTDAARIEAGRRLWRKLLAAPPLLDDLAGAIARTENMPEPEPDAGDGMLHNPELHKPAERHGSEEAP